MISCYTSIAFLLITRLGGCLTIELDTGEGLGAYRTQYAKYDHHPEPAQQYYVTAKTYLDYQQQEQAPTEGYHHHNDYHNYIDADSTNHLVLQSTGGHGHDKEVKDYHDEPKYHFDYAVHDLHTQDVKSQWETRDGDKVRGEYTLLEADGSTRIVSYTADKHSGFNAVVKTVKD